LQKGKSKATGATAPRLDELAQINGLYRAWLEDRTEKSCLLLFIDDATSEILVVEFMEHECFLPYESIIFVNLILQKSST